MPRKHITQKEARGLKAEIARLEGRLAILSYAQPGTQVDNTRLQRDEVIRVSMAIKFGYVLILKPTGTWDVFDIRAVKP